MKPGRNKLGKVQAQVRAVLEDKPATRNDDMLLWLGVCRRYYQSEYLAMYLLIKDSIRELGFDQSNYRHVKNLPSSETVRRTRQIIQNTEGKLLPTDPTVIKKRRINQKEWQTELGYSTEHIHQYVANEFGDEER